jgi:tRNA threonylcarbamoyladenosine biosynthesis protein TsaE
MDIFAPLMKKEFWNIDSESLVRLASQVIPNMETHRVWTFTGNLGAGKTTFIKTLCHQLGVKGEIQSPTFSIVNTYETANGEEIFHFDCYRLKDWNEALDFGIEEYLFSGNICLIEWPEVIENLLPDNPVQVFIETQENDLRKFTIEGITEWKQTR